MGTRLFPLERDALVKPPGLCPGFSFPAEEEMQANSGGKKQKEQKPCSGQTLPCINGNCDCEQNAVFDNAKPSRLRMQGDVFFLPVEFLEGHVLFGKADSGVGCQANEMEKKECFIHIKCPCGYILSTIQNSKTAAVSSQWQGRKWR